MSDKDPLLWLEQVDGEQALAWVKTQNQATTDALASDQDFAALRQRLLAILNADTRIPYVKQRGEHVYNFWQDANHIKGVWRRTTLTAYRTETPDWEVVLDLDALAKQENENWVWRGAECLKPDNQRCRDRHPRVRYSQPPVCRRRFLSPRGQGRGGLDRPRPYLRRHRFWR